MLRLKASAEDIVMVMNRQTVMYRKNLGKSLRQVIPVMMMSLVNKMFVALGDQKGLPTPVGVNVIPDLK